MTGAPDAATVTVVVPTFNRVDRLRALLDALARQSWPADRFEVVVVSDGSTDGTDDYLAGPLPRPVRAVLQANAGPAVARNRGVEAATGSLIVFLDDDVVADVGLVEEHVKSHDGDDGRSVVIGPMLTPEGFHMSPWVRWEQAMLEKQYEDLLRGRYEARSRQFYTGNVSLARRQILDAGGFDPQFRRAEDIELAYRLEAAGARFVFNARAVTYHFAERSFASWLQIPRAYGATKVAFAGEGRAWVLQDAANEFQELNALNRLAARGLVGRPRTLSALASAISWLAPIGERIGLDRLVRYALSGLYNLEYCQGLADALGGTRAFVALMATGQRRTFVTPAGDP